MSRSSIHRNDSDAPAITKMPTRISAEMRHSEGKLVVLNQKNRLFLQTEQQQAQYTLEQFQSLSHLPLASNHG
jgi:hypothetical protein